MGQVEEDYPPSPLATSVRCRHRLHRRLRLHGVVEWRIMSTASSSEKSRKDSKSGPKASKALTTSAKRIQKELAEITLDPPPNCR